MIFKSKSGARCRMLPNLIKHFPMLAVTVTAIRSSQDVFSTPKQWRHFNRFWACTENVIISLFLIPAQPLSVTLFRIIGLQHLQAWHDIAFFVQLLIKCCDIDIYIGMCLLKISTPSGAATRHISLIVFAPRFFRVLTASTAEPPVASIGSMTINSRSFTSFGSFT